MLLHTTSYCRFMKTLATFFSLLLTAVCHYIWLHTTSYCRFMKTLATFGEETAVTSFVRQWLLTKVMK